MAVLQLLKSSPSNCPGKIGCFWLEVATKASAKRGLRVQKSGIALDCMRFRVNCKAEDISNPSNGEVPPESLFMKELKRRGITPTSLTEEKSNNIEKDDDVKLREEDGGWGYSRRNGVTIDDERNVSNQREKSMALNSEGLEGLIPRARLLLALGGTFFLAFWPLIVATVAFFLALYLYFGPEFVHDGSNNSIAPSYIDPYALLEEERIYKTNLLPN